MTQKPEWQLVFVLQNLDLEGEHDQWPSELTLGLDGIAIVSASDARVVEIGEWSEAAAKFLASFRDGITGDNITPAVLIVRNDWHSKLDGDPEPVVSFRNAAALVSILLTRAEWPNEAVVGPAWSDTFNLHPCQVKRDGSGWYVRTPALLMRVDSLKGLSLTSDIGISRPRLGPIDEPLAKRLGCAWYTQFFQHQDKSKTRRIFRSLESAYEASAVRFKNLLSLNELGLGTVPWTTAIEVLASTGRVTKWDCIKLIKRGPPPWDNRIWHRRFWIKEKKKGERCYMTFPQRTCLSLHDARSKFAPAGATCPPPAQPVPACPARP